MGTLKYEHLLKPLAIGAHDWEKGALAIGPGNAGREIMLNGRDHLESLNLNLSWGVHNGLGDWHAGMDPHVHPYPEVLLFVGLDTANVNYLGAQVDCCLGEEQEIYTFDEPTVIVVPAGVPHGPITTKRMFSPRGFGFWAVELNAIPKITWMGEAVAALSAEQSKSAPDGLNFVSAEKALRNKPVPATGKYAHLVKPLKSGLLMERGKLNASRFTPEQLAQQMEKSRQTGEKPGPGNADHLVMFSGKDLGGLNVSLFWGFCSQPGIWRRGLNAHVHEADEVLVFLGTDPEVQALGAEIELDLGKEHERHKIGQPTAVVCPAGMPHLPLVSHWVDKPFAFFAVCLSSEHEPKAFD